jgi:DNA replication protein DnaC
MELESIGKTLKGFNLEEIRQRSQRNQSQAGKTEGLDQEKIRCQTCRDELGNLIRNDDGYEVWKPCTACRDWRKAEKIMKQSHITPEFQKMSFEGFTNANRPQNIIEAKECAEDYLRDFQTIRHERKNGIALLGIPGCGKTHLLMAVANGLIAQNVPVIYFPWVEGFNELKANLDSLEDRIGLLQRVDVLYIDDMWKGRKEPTPFQLEQAFAIINYRYLNKLPILISSEHDIDSMCHFDMAIGSRIYEMCKEYLAVIKGDPKIINYRLSED